MKGREEEQTKVGMKGREKEQTKAGMKEKEPALPDLSGEKAARFDREELLASKRYRGCRDLAEALFENDRQYTMEEADGLIGSYMKGKVV